MDCWIVALSIFGVISGAVGTIAGLWGAKTAKRALRFEEKKYERSVTPDIGVECGYGVLVGGYDENGGVLNVTARNNGEVRVILSSVTMCVPDLLKKHLTIIPDGYCVRLPHILEPADSHFVAIKLNEIARSLKGQGLSGKVGLDAFFTDKLGREFHCAEKTVFDIDEWFSPEN